MFSNAKEDGGTIVGALADLFTEQPICGIATSDKFNIEEDHITTSDMEWLQGSKSLKGRDMASSTESDDGNKVNKISQI